MSPATRNLLTSLKIWESLDQTRIAPVYDMRIYQQAQPGAAEVHFDAFEAGVDALAWIVEGTNLSRTVQQAVGSSPVQAVNAAVVGFEQAPRAAHLVLDDGRRVKARLVVAADGAESVCRTLAGIETKVRAYGQTAVVANFTCEQPHRDCAYQWFGAHGILALLPLPGDRCSMVWSAPSDLADELLALAPAALGERVAATSGHALGGLQTLAPAKAFPLQLMRPLRQIGPRLVLVGDAAHVIHPLAGQGMNLGFGDVATLLKVLAGRERYRELGDPLLLRRFERARREPVAAMRLATDGLQRLFDLDKMPSLAWFSGPLRGMRDVGWQLTARSGWLKRRLIAAAALQE